MTRIAVFGGSGFVGSAIVAHLRGRGDDVTVLRAPRLRSTAGTVAEVLVAAATADEELPRRLRGFDAVVNAAGVAQAPSRDQSLLVGANALLPTLIHNAARAADVPRFVHVSSAAVQGRAARLDEGPARGADSVYARSKALGEQALMASGEGDCIVLRPTSVHGTGRRVTQRLAALARSPFSVAQAPGTRHTPQVHVDSVARAVGVLVDPAEAPPPVVLQPSEGFSVATFLTVMAGGKAPRLLPRWVTAATIHGAYSVARVGGSPVWAQARRAEMLMRGQDQDPGWLASRNDVVSPRAVWEDMADACRTAAEGAANRRS